MDGYAFTGVTDTKAIIMRSNQLINNTKKEVFISCVTDVEKYLNIYIKYTCMYVSGCVCMCLYKYVNIYTHITQRDRHINKVSEMRKKENVFI